VDLKKAQEQFQRAQQAVENLPPGMDIADALDESMKAQAQLDLAKRFNGF
jgi:hypothetical protein